MLFDESATTFYLTGTSAVHQVIAHRAIPGSMPLADIVTALCLRAGLTVVDLDVSELTDGVRGYALARPAEQIGVNEVIEAIEGPIAVTECSDDTTDSSCEYETNCGVRANWQRINVAVHRALSEITLADMGFPGTAELVLIARSSKEAEQMRSASPQGNDVH